MTFDDEFNNFTSSSDGSTGWMTAYPYGAAAAHTLAANNEAEYYGDANNGLNPFSLQNGVLSITATLAAGSNPYGLPYNSGVITTAKDFSQTYGYFEVRAELPAGAGLWPAFWMLPASINYTSELDVFEQLGSSPSTIYATVHGATNGVWGANSQAFQVANTSTGFHTYGVDWEPTTTTYYVDGVAIGSAPTPSSMNDPMFMIINLAVGGNGSWPGAPTSSTILPASLKIDYVHAYATANTSYVGGSAAIPAGSAAAIVSPSATSVVTPTPTATGTQSLTLQVSEDAWSGDAQFQVTVDGVAIGGVQTATASHAAGLTDTINLTGTWAAGAHNVGVNFLNDAYGGNANMDRNLYVSAISLAGVAATGAPSALMSSGTVSFIVPTANTTTTPVTVSTPGAPSSTTQALVLQVSEDAWNGDAQFQVTVDGVAVGGVQTATASHNAGLASTVSLSGTWAAGAHSVGVNFLNDAYGGSAGMDRNLYVGSISLGGVAATGAPAALMSSGSVSFAVSAGADNPTPAATTPTPTPTPTPTVTPVATPTSATSQSLTLQVSEDAWNGDAQYQVTVDGVAVGGVQTATASHNSGQSSIVTLTGTWDAGAHIVGVDFLNDAYGGSSSTDRNLYVSSINLGGATAGGAPAALLSSGTASFLIPAHAAPATAANILTLNLSEDAYLGDAQFTVAIDGVQQGGTQSVTTLHASGNAEAFGYNLALSAGVHDVAVSFLNDAYGGNANADRNLYVNSATFGGTNISGAASTLLSAGTNHFAILMSPTA
jgi:beta-glucanase (GH16 family)